MIAVSRLTSDCTRPGIGGRSLVLKSTSLAANFRRVNSVVRRRDLAYLQVAGLLWSATGAGDEG